MFVAALFVTAKNWKLNVYQTGWVNQMWSIQWNVAAAAAKSLQLCLTLCNPIDGSPPASTIPGLQARTLEGCHFLLQCMKVKRESEVA